MNKQTTRITLQESPRITVCFPPTYTKEQKDMWLAKWYRYNNRTH